MLRSLKALHGYTVLAKDGDIGKVNDFYFHDDTWTIRYLVVDTGHWLPGRKILVTPAALGKPNWADFTFPVALTRKQVKTSPDIDTDKPVSRQHEAALYAHYGWLPYWSDAGFGAWPPPAPSRPVAHEVSEQAAKHKADAHLRSAREVTGYHIHASDGEMGRVADLIADDAHWVMRYMVIDASKWLQTRQVLISTQWLGEIGCAGRKVDVALTKDRIQHCPEFYPGAPVNREYEERLYDYYGRPGYWEDAGRAAQPPKLRRVRGKRGAPVGKAK